MSFNADEKACLLGVARESLTSIEKRPVEKVLGEVRARTDLSPRVLVAAPCFVTLYRTGERLRGCVGCVTSDQPLIENVVRFTRHAALDDPRFPPVDSEESAELSLHISVLGGLEKLPSLESIAIGRHGLWVRQGSRRGLLLADVARRYGWDPQEFLRQTCLKAGLPPENHASYEIRYFEEVSFSE